MILASGCATLPRLESDREGLICDRAKLQARLDTSGFKWGAGGFVTGAGVTTLAIPLVLAAAMDREAPADALAPYTATERDTYARCYSATRMRERQVYALKGCGLLWGSVFVALLVGQLVAASQK